MRQLLLSFFILTCWPLHGGIEVTFPVATKPEGDGKPEGAKPIILQDLTVDDSLDPVRIDGLVAYYYGTQFYGGGSLKPEGFDKLKEGMTLREIVTLLGPGSQSKIEGVGFIRWRCSDGRTLHVWPIRQLDEEARYHISLCGSNQRHEVIAELTKSLISRIDISGQKVEVTLTLDTNQAKAGQVRIYEVGQTFQKVEPLPRVDFTITKIAGDSVHCRYYYQAMPEGLLRYSETGDLIIHNREQAGSGQPATHPESK